MSIKVTKSNLIPVRRDKQISSISVSSGGGASVGGSVVGGSSSSGATYDDSEIRSMLSGVSSTLATEISSSVHKVGVQADNQVGVFTGDGTIESTTGLTFAYSPGDGTNFLRVAGDVYTIGAFGFAPYGEFYAHNAFYRGGTDIQILRNYNQVYTVMDIWAPPGALGSGDREATLTLLRGNEPNQEFVDIYNNGYSSEMQFGNRIQKRGSGIFRDFVFDASDGSTKTPIYKIKTTNLNSATTVDFNFDTNLGSTTFSSGYAGSGWRLDKVTNTLEVGNLIVKDKFSAYELEINEITSIGGSFLCSAANGIPYLVSGTRFYFDEDGGANPINFVVNDKVKAQIWTGAGIGVYLGTVTNVVHSATLGSAYIDCTTISGTPWSKMKLVVVGNSSTANRQNLIYMTSSDSNAPYLDMITGSTDGVFTNRQVLRLGSLTGISDPAFGGALNSFGLYATNVYLKGKIVISGGSGYANLTDKPTTLSAVDSSAATKLNGIAAGATNVTNTNQLTDGANLGGTATWSGISSKPARFADAPSGAGLCLTGSYMGYYDGGTWQSYIDSSGNSKFVGVTEIGTATQSYGGTYGGTCNVAIKGADIWENSANGQSSLYINRIGYAGGTTQWRALTLGDGKGGSHMDFWYNTNTQYYWGIQCGSLKGQTGNEDYTDRKLRYYGTSWFYGETYFGQNVSFGTYCNTTASGTHTAANFILNSDERLKENIKPLRFKSIPIKYKEFELKADKGQKRVGVIAQELQITNPEFVREDKEGMLSVAYIDLLMAKVSELESRIKELENR